MEWVNITAKSLPEAIDLALDNLGVDESEAEIEVLEEPKQGLFGRTRGNARVRARVKPKATRPKVERSRGRKRRSETASGSGSGPGPKRSGRSSSNDRDEKRASGTASETGTRSDVATADTSAGDSEGRSETGRDNGSSGGESKRKRSGGSRKRSSASQADEFNSQEATMAEVSQHLEEFLSGLTEAFGYEGAVTVEEGDDELLVSVEGRHGLMVGPRGRTLDAIQELARVSAQRTTPSSVRIKVDVGGYRDLRRSALEEFAAEAAEDALSDGKERELEPMSSADRKIIHDALADNPDVETRSAGNEPHRRVVVVPMNVDVDEADVYDEDVDDVEELEDVEDVEDVEELDDASAEDADETAADVETVG